MDEAKEAVRLLRELREECQEGAARKVLDVVDYTANHEMLYPVMTQMIYLIFSQITLSCFLSDLLDEEALPVRLEYDTKKIARNFSGYEPGQKAEAFSCALDSFCEICWSPDLLDIVCKHFRFSGGPAQTDDACSERCSEEMLLRVMEETSISRRLSMSGALKGREPLYFRRTAPRQYSGYHRRTARSCFYRVRTFKVQAEKQDLSMNLAVLYALTHEMDVGDVSLKARAERVDDVYICYSAVRNTELSLSILPEDLGTFTRRCWKSQGCLEGKEVSGMD